MRKVLQYLTIIIIANLSFLFSPRPSDYELSKGPHTYVMLNNWMGFTINGDSFSFIGCAIQPSYILQRNNIRQSRPLYIYFGTAIGNIIYYAFSPFHDQIKNYLKKKNIFQNNYSPLQFKKATQYFCFYLGYILLNIFILLLSFILFEKIIIALSGDWKNGTLLFSAILLMIASNPLTRIYFWTPHQQLLNILTPLLCVYLGLYIVKKQIIYSKLLLIASGLGLLLLLYGNFLLTLPILLFGFLLEEKKRNKKLTVNHTIKFIGLLVGFFFPTISWIIYLQFIGISFYSPELSKYRQFVWILDGLKDPFHSFFPAFYSYTSYFLKTFGCLLIPIILLFTALLIHKKKSGNKTRSLHSLINGQEVILLFVSIETFIFFWLLGYNADRLTFSLAPLLLCYTALILNFQKIGNKLKYLLAGLIAVFHVYNVFVIPLHFSDMLFFA